MDRKKNANLLNPLPPGPKKVTSQKSSYATNNRSASETKSCREECLLLDRLLTGFHIKNDAQLAAWLGIDKSLIYAVRAGKRRLGLTQRLKVLDHLGFLKARSLLEAILPENLARDLVTFNRAIVNRQISDRVVAAHDPNAHLLEAARVAFDFQTDAAFAAFLGVECNTLSTVRAGKSALGPKPRLRILERLTGAFDAERLIETLESSRQLIRLIDRWVKDQRQQANA